MRRPSLPFLLGVLAAFGGTPASAHLEADGLVVRQGGVPVVQVWQGVVEGSLGVVPYLSASADFEVAFLDPDSLEISGQPAGVHIAHLPGTPGLAQFDQTAQWGFTLTGLQAGGSGTIRLRIWNVDHYDFTSPHIPFSVFDPAVVAAPVTFGGESITVVPNPFRGQGEVWFSLSRPGPVHLRLYDAAGRLVEVLERGDLAAGAVRSPLVIGSTQPRGVYFLRLVTPTATLTHKLLLLP